jgi:hypothetical protein
MKQSPPYRRVVLVGLVTVGVLLLILYLSRSSGSVDGNASFATPDACLDAFRDARAEGDAGGYLRCLAEPLRSETRRKYANDVELGLAIRAEMKDVKSWAVTARPDIQSTNGTAIVEEVCASGVREVRLQLERSSDGWKIMAIDKGKERPASMPYGTTVGAEPDGKTQRKQ